MVYALEINPTTFPAARFGTIGNILNLVIPTITVGASVVFLFMIIYAAITYIQSGGDAKKVTQAQSMFVYAIIGIILVVIANIIVRIIGYITKVEIPI